MDYDLHKPCSSCPFRSDIRPYLTYDRVREIEDSLVRGTFPCHKSVDYDTLEKQDHEHDDPLPHSVDEKSKHCAGALILLEKEESPSQMMRICERIGLYDREKLDMDAPVYDSFDEMCDAQDQ